MKIDAAVLQAVGAELVVEGLELESPKTGEVLVEIKASGVCHSDWHVVTGDSEVDLPVVLGHEGSGIVREIGPDVDDVAVGDHVALSWIPYCGRCNACLAGHTHLCQTYLPALWAGTMLDGSIRLKDGSGEPVHHLSALSTWANYAVVPAISCIKMPDVPFEVSALIGCGVTTGVGAALNRARVQRDSTVVVFGAGGVGLSIVMGSVLADAKSVIVIDVNHNKETLARSLGATEFVVSDDPVSVVGELTHGQGADYAFDAVGHTGVESMLVDVLGPRGTAVMVGFPRAGLTFEVNPHQVIRGEKTITGSIFGSAHTTSDFVRYAGWYLDGRLPLDRLITARYPLSEINTACAEMLDGATGRVVLEF